MCCSGGADGIGVATEVSIEGSAGTEGLASSEEEGEEEEITRERNRETIGSESQSGSGAESSVLEEGVSGDG